jgi:hypothetical protein
MENDFMQFYFTTKKCTVGGVCLPFVSFNLSSHFVQEMQKECLQSSPSPYDVYYPYLQWVSSISILFIPGRLCKVESPSQSVSPN